VAKQLEASNLEVRINKHVSIKVWDCVGTEMEICVIHVAV
jgi:hypothetical protein